ncbi:hypothetical protein FNV43_RR00307 [Rhamnella rubrinervis]|uniref:Uncharacterized protein n=1 Tax=Rhamnella rubrinervis TaxID=2594499 RepID=A0A8K0HMT1_9ROSA|nr:hypothetical protein FNV43_RR00307 [Rhamnella rubrinervis]
MEFIIANHTKSYYFRPAWSSIHRATNALRGVIKGIFNRGGGANPADQPESFMATNGADPSHNLYYGAPEPVPSPGRVNYEYENSNQRIKQHGVKIRTCYSIGNDNGAVVIEGSDQQKIRSIRNQTGNNMGSRNGVIEITSITNQQKIHGIRNRSCNNGNVRIENIRST